MDEILTYHKEDTTKEELTDDLPAWKKAALERRKSRLSVTPKDAAEIEQIAYTADEESEEQILRKPMLDQDPIHVKSRMRHMAAGEVDMSKLADFVLGRG